ncbi:phosphotransferase family protein [Chungangia koreensis]|uniref:Phosphotransferase family protein n=1 Tax=Chungangia koreensis TaxID=752657 RepID=A0ABV8X1F4_9LACT
MKNYIERINQIYSELQIQTATPNDIGQNNDVLVINDSLIFRFPKYQNGIERLAEEKEILNRVRKFVSLPTPKFKYQSFDEPEVGKVFVGYEIIEGVPFWKESFYEIKDAKLKREIAEQLTTFLKELHSIPKIELVEIGLKEHHPIEVMAEMHKKIQEKLFSFMRADAKEEITLSFKDFLENNREIETALIHGDFGSSNILWDPTLKEITGVIDFGGSGLGDPAYDLAGILSSFGEDFYRLCLSLYPNGEEISERVKFYRSTFALQEALHGIEHNDEEAFEAGIKNYR